MSEVDIPEWQKIFEDPTRKKVYLQALPQEALYLGSYTNLSNAYGETAARVKLAEQLWCESPERFNKSLQRDTRQNFRSEVPDVFEYMEAIKQREADAFPPDTRPPWLDEAYERLMPETTAKDVLEELNPPVALPSVADVLEKMIITGHAQAAQPAYNAFFNALQETRGEEQGRNTAQAVLYNILKDMAPETLRAARPIGVPNGLAVFTVIETMRDKVLQLPTPEQGVIR